MEPGVDGARKQIAEVVAERIERLILDGVLKAGQALPSERRLTEKLGVSRTALREGLRVLRARQIIHTAQGKGSYVAQISQVDAGPLVHLFNSQPRTLYDLLEVRALLESESAVLAREPEQAHQAARAHVDSVRQSLAEIEQEEQRLVRATLRLEGWV
ncbi:GntR family transcriptional regulator [Bordetella bronchiseptica]|uniref:GntR family transcriptional regulator n=1 Tax=Bordetella bronchiseptica TaxID=518 RepID=UPI000459F9B1|nr:GntR family transcriptional regulator [Bordetella bronchiseptica]KCV49244.1 putative pyruvate dehydrogenase complex repressor [Bordetella bronchiseptica 3E44]